MKPSDDAYRCEPRPKYAMKICPLKLHSAWKSPKSLKCLCRIFRAKNHCFKKILCKKWIWIFAPKKDADRKYYLNFRAKIRLFKSEFLCQNYSQTIWIFALKLVFRFKYIFLAGKFKPVKTHVIIDCLTQTQHVFFQACHSFSLPSPSTSSPPVFTKLETKWKKMTLLNTTELVNNAFPTTEFRQLSGGQLAVAGVAIAVISMILEFIAMSGFAPKVK